MTKSREHGENEITDEAKREALRTGDDICAVLARMLKRAKAAGDTDRIRKIVQAQKYLGCRNIQKRRARP
jgi:hypothetical protein